MQKEKPIGITEKKSANFSEWYTQVITKADLADYSSVSGCIVFKPNSYSIWEKIVAIVDERFKKMSIKNAYFPLLIPEKLLKKEQHHVEGFSPEVAWVTHAGDSKLDERLAVRPTSETIMYESYSKWIRSWRDLPLKLNQWNSVVRWEFKHPVPFLRTREFLWNEGHTAFATKKEAEKEVFEVLDMYSEVLEKYLALPGIKGRKTEKEKFAGAEYTLAIELFLPNGKAIQGPDSHFDGQNFAKAFDINFLDKEGKREYVWQNTFAITTRMIGVMVAVHSDDKGLILPPTIAPIQIVIVPILFEETQDKVMQKCNEVKKSLEKYSVFIDDRDSYTPGWKFNEWEMKGVPLRIEIGPKDIEKGTAVITRRDTGKKEFVKFNELEKKAEAVLAEINSNLYKKAKELLDTNIIETDSSKELEKGIMQDKLVLAPHCGLKECEDAIKEKTGAKALVIPFEQPKKKGKCAFCGKEAEYSVYFGKSY